MVIFDVLSPPVDLADNTGAWYTRDPCAAQRVAGSEAEIPRDRDSHHGAA